MPFIRYTRDKRGYECTMVLHQYRPSQGPQRTRVLYLFRSPASVKIGRTALDAEVVEALEHTHPDLSFDWTALQRDMAPLRPEPRERPVRATRRTRPEARPAEPAPVRIDDQSLLGRVAGAERAALLRQQHTELLQRILRRARTPEDRDRLTERAVRLNPDDWPDEATVRSGLATLEEEWAAIAAELPQRRRGRRGGRHRADRAEGREISAGSPADAAPSGVAAAGTGPGPSGIMAGDRGDGHAEGFAEHETVDGSADPGGSRGDNRAVGPDPTDPPAAGTDDVPGDR